MKVEQLQVDDLVFGFADRPVTVLTRMLRVEKVSVTDRFVTLELRTFGRARYKKGQSVPFREVHRGGEIIFQQEGR